MKRKIYIIVMIMVMVAGLIESNEVCADVLGVSAQSAVVMEAKTGKVLYEKNGYEKRPMASTTKIMTTLLLLESGDLDSQFTVDPEAIKVEGSSMGLIEGDIVTKRALCIGMLLPSGNDAANVTAKLLGGTTENFATMMNERAKLIGMENTRFVTPSGLHDDNHYSTAYDMALLACEALKNENFRDICGKKTIKLQYGNPPYDRWLKNTNKMLECYPGCIGVKTGFTDEAGRCLVSAAEKDGKEIVCVTLKACDDWNDHTKMLNYGFSQLTLKELPLPSETGTIKVVGGYEDKVATAIKDKASASFIAGDESNVKYRIIKPAFIYAPVISGQVIGEIRYYYNDREIGKVDILAKENVYYNFKANEKWYNKIVEKIKEFYK